MMNRMKKGTLIPFLEVIILLILSALLAACGPVDESPVSPTAVPVQEGEETEPAAEAYPAPPATVSPAEAYPAPSDAVNSGPLFAFDKPIQAGDTVISGVGPAGLSILILNVTFMGEEIGAGIVSDDGTFSVEVAPLQAAVRIGLTADLEAQGVNIEDIQPSDGAINIPQVGYFFDSAVIPGE